MLTNTPVLLLILRKEVGLLHRLLRDDLLVGSEIVHSKDDRNDGHHDDGNPIPRLLTPLLHPNVPHAAVVHNLHGLVEEGGGVVVTVGLVENGQSHLVLLRVDEVVHSEHVHKVHLISRVQSRVEVSLSELRLSPLLHSHILMVDGEVVGVVQRSHAIRNIVHSNTIVLQIHNHTNRFRNREILYASRP